MQTHRKFRSVGVGRAKEITIILVKCTFFWWQPGILFSQLFYVYYWFFFFHLWRLLFLLLRHLSHAAAARGERWWTPDVNCSGAALDLTGCQSLVYIQASETHTNTEAQSRWLGASYHNYISGEDRDHRDILVKGGLFYSAEWSLFPLV